MRNIVLFILSVAGLAFASYTSAVKLLTSTCAFSEPCPYFLGYPACYFGFALFAVLSVVSYLLLFGYAHALRARRAMILFSLLGVLFAGYFTLEELPTLFAKGLGAYVLGLPTCALGLLFFLAILLISTKKPRV